MNRNRLILSVLLLLPLLHGSHLLFKRKLLELLLREIPGLPKLLLHGFVLLLLVVPLLL